MTKNIFGAKITYLLELFAKPTHTRRQTLKNLFFFAELEKLKLKNSGLQISCKLELKLD